MKVPLSWIKDFVDIEIPIPELAHRLTMAGLEVEGIQIIGLPVPEKESGDWTSGHVHKADTKITGLEWDAAKIVVASISEVLPHPNADRLVLCKLFDGEREHIVLTGAPNLFDYKGKGPLPNPLKVAYAREGARIYDGHQPGQVLTTLKRTKIRGIDSYSMVCSEKELGISDEHEGIIILDEDATAGMPLADYMGDAVFDITILPNIARAVNVLGVAREVAALTGKSLRQPSYDFLAEGEPIEGLVSIEIQNPQLNPRFVLGLIRDVKIGPSPYKVQRRLKLAGMRPINNIVDATNYVMLEVGEPLHAFDYDVLVQRAAGKPVQIITRTAYPGERLTTLDGVERTLDTTTVLVCDTAGALSIAGIMGGAESEVYDASHEILDATGVNLKEGTSQTGKIYLRSKSTTNILLEGAAWHYTNIRKTTQTQNLPSEASFRFSRGVHPAMAERGVRRCLEFMRLTSGGVVAKGLVDSYPLPPVTPAVEITPADTVRWLGIEIPAAEIVKILESLEFKCSVTSIQYPVSSIQSSATDSLITVTAPDHRMDIGEGIIGKADLMEEVARIYGYDRIPETRLTDELPPQRGNPTLDREEKIRDQLIQLGLQEVVSYRLTHPDREVRRLPSVRAGMESLPTSMPIVHGPAPTDDGKPYVRLANPISNDRVVLRHSVLASVMDVLERNVRLRERIALFEIGPIFIASEEGILPDELQRLVIVLSGPRALPGWQKADTTAMDFYDLKGMIASMLDGLHVINVHYEPGNHPTFHPGKCARVLVGDRQIGVFGEIHPLVRERYDLPVSTGGPESRAQNPILAADLDLDALLALIPDRYDSNPVPEYPPVLEDLAVVVDEAIPAGKVADVIRETGGKMITNVRLFDVYRSEQIGAGKKSLAYNIAYQATDKTLTDKDVAQIRQRIVRRLEQTVRAKLRG